jgi:mannose-1-phosphate guanylyltransferase
LFQKISFDYEVAEKAVSVAMILYHGRWKDLGTWNTLSEELDLECIGEVTLGEDTVNTTVINELSIPTVVLGVENLIVAASPDGILISDKQKSSYLKSYVDSLNQRPMYEEGIWGEYKALDYKQYQDGSKSLTKHLTIKAGQFIGYLAHRIRDEILTVVDGSGEVVIDGSVRKVGRGDIIHITKGQRHAIKAYPDNDLQFIEVQIGTELMENDVEAFEWRW